MNATTIPTSNLTNFDDFDQNMMPIEEDDIDNDKLKRLRINGSDTSANNSKNLVPRLISSSVAGSSSLGI